MAKIRTFEIHLVGGPRCGEKTTCAKPYFKMVHEDGTVYSADPEAKGFVKVIRPDDALPFGKIILRYSGREKPVAKSD